MIQPLDQSIIELFNALRDDEETMRLALPERSFGFHAQQATEKLLKILVAAHSERYAFVHDLEQLLNHVLRLEGAIPVRMDLLTSLTAFAGRWRYEEPKTSVPLDRDEIRDQVSELEGYVVARVKVLRPHVDWDTALSKA
jgi:HEPN domain-containing protein